MINVSQITENTVNELHSFEFEKDEFEVDLYWKPNVVVVIKQIERAKKANKTFKFNSDYECIPSSLKFVHSNDFFTRFVTQRSMPVFTMKTTDGKTLTFWVNYYYQLVSIK